MLCPICQSNAQATPLDALNLLMRIDCPRCGRFQFTDGFDETRPNLTALQIANISGWTRQNQGSELRQTDWDRLISLRSPSVGEKADKLLHLLARQFPIAGQTITFQPTPEILSVCWAVDVAEANYLYFSYLRGYKGFVASPVGVVGSTIAPAGWDYIHSLRKTNAASGIGFCAMWFNDRLEPTWANALEPAIKAAGYEPKRIDKHPHNNRIDDEIIAMVRRSRFVVSDLTGNRPGVYFESGFAYGLGLPVVWTCRMDRLHRVHFDNRQYNFVLWHANKLSQFKDALQLRIEATIGRGPIA